MLIRRATQFELKDNKAGRLVGVAVTISTVDHVFLAYCDSEFGRFMLMKSFK